eukprot:m.157891 g.157891  ORF g.157891 m.157891 type:complete len:81 (-) comp14336_c0_seq1:2882-3124(-)
MHQLVTRPVSTSPQNKVLDKALHNHPPVSTPRRRTCALVCFGAFTIKQPTWHSFRINTTKRLTFKKENGQTIHSVVFCRT